MAANEEAPVQRAFFPGFGYEAQQQAGEPAALRESPASCHQLFERETRFSAGNPSQREANHSPRKDAEIDLSLRLGSS